MNLASRFQQLTLRLGSWLAIAGALLFGLGLYIQNLAAFPSNVGVSEWWGSELAIRYCSGFVRRGLLGQISWLTTGWLGYQAFYVQVLALLMAGAVLLLGFALGVGLVRRCGWRVGLLILMAPVGWPVMLNHAGALFRKDALQVVLGAVLLAVWRWGWIQSVGFKKVLIGLLLTSIEVLAVFNHEPFALLILPVLAIAVFARSRSFWQSFVLIGPGCLAFLIAAWKRGDWAQVQCLGSDLQRLQLLLPGALPGSSITELALSKPSFFTWDLLPGQLFWSLVHGLVMSLAAVSAYALLMRRSGLQRAWFGAMALWLTQCLCAMPLFLATIDYGRWFSMMFGAGLFLILICLSRPSRELYGAGTLECSLPSQWTLLLLELVVIPTHCCTYSFDSIFAPIPYAALGLLKRSVF